MSSAQGRFTSPDPFNLGADPTNPQPWNGYAYVRNNPLNRVDPSGFCDAFIAGIQENPGEDPTIDQFSANMIAIFPYATTNLLSGLLGVATDSGDAAALTGLRAALAQTPAGESVNVFTVSGGSRAFSSAYSQLSSSEQSRIGNVAYLIPGNFSGSLQSGNASTLYVEGGGGLDSWIYSGRPANYECLAGMQENGAACGHNASCVLNALAKRLKEISGSPCGTHQVITRNRYPHLLHRSPL
jgi:hypothetical protein